MRNITRESKVNNDKKRPPYFIDLEQASKFTQMEGLEMTVLTGLHGEQMMMVLNATLPGHTVPTHSHLHEQIGMVYRGRAILRIGDEDWLAFAHVVIAVAFWGPLRDPVKNIASTGH